MPQKPLVDRVREGSLDIALCRHITDRDDAAGLEQSVLFDEDYVLVAGRSHRFARSRSVKLAELIDDPWILPHGSGPFHAHVQALFLGRVGCMPANVVESSTPLAANLQLVEQYGFLNFMQKTVAQRYAQRRQLSILPITLSNPLGPHVIAVRANMGASPAVRTVLEALRDAAAAELPENQQALQALRA